MSRHAADPASLAITCPRCGRPPLTRCLSPYGGPTNTHAARIRAGQAAREVSSRA